MQAGYTRLDLESPDGDDVRTFVPRKTFNLLARYSPSFLPGFEIGGSIKWQDRIHLDNGLGDIEQDARAVVCTFASFEFGRHFELAMNVNNLTDEKYLTSLYWDQSFYAAPRNVTATLRMKY